MNDFRPDPAAQLAACREELLRIEHDTYREVMSWPGLPAWAVEKLKEKLQKKALDK